jgi:hypothetical protein
MANEGDLTSGRGIIRFDCPRCLATIKVPASKGGRASKCPKCEKRLTIPERDLEPLPELVDEELELKPSEDRDREPCRHCGKSIKAGAAKCRHCQRWITKPADVWADEREERMAMQSEQGTGLLPTLLKIYGVGIIILASLSLAGAVVNFSIIAILVNIVIIRLGLGLYRAQRTAVIGLGILFLLFLIGGGVLVTSRSGRELGLVLIVASFVMHGLPALIGILSWKRLTN